MNSRISNRNIAQMKCLTRNIHHSISSKPSNLLYNTSTNEVTTPKLKARDMKPSLLPFTGGHHNNEKLKQQSGNSNQVSGINPNPSSSTTTITEDKPLMPEGTAKIKSPDPSLDKSRNLNNKQKRLKECSNSTFGPNSKSLGLNSKTNKVDMPLDLKGGALTPSTLHTCSSNRSIVQQTNQKECSTKIYTTGPNPEPRQNTKDIDVYKE